MCKYMVKVISLSEEAYSKLKSLKNENSFSEVVITLVEEHKKKNIMGFAGILKENKEEWGKIKEKLEKDRKNVKLKEIKF